MKVIDIITSFSYYTIKMSYTRGSRLLSRSKINSTWGGGEGCVETLRNTRAISSATKPRCKLLRGCRESRSVEDTECSV